MSTKRDDEISADDASPNVLSKPSSPTLSENSIAFSAEKLSTTEKKVGDKSRKDKPTTGDRAKPPPMPSNEKGRSEKSHESSKSSSKGGQSSGSKASQSQDETVEPKVERKVSRYSERRNKVKQVSKLENSDTATDDVMKAIDEPKDNSAEISNSEI